MCKPFFRKMKTLLRLDFEVNCNVKEPYYTNEEKKILKYKPFVEHTDII